MTAFRIFMGAVCTRFHGAGNSRSEQYPSTPRRLTRRNSISTVGCGWFLWNAIPLPCILRLMSQAPTTLGPDANLKWYQGLDRYCWIVLLISALGWLFDTMDQNLFNIVRTPSLNDLLRPLHTD